MRGAFGLALASGLGSDHEALPTAPPSWPAWQVRLTSSERLGDNDLMTVPLLVGGAVMIDPARKTAWLCDTPTPSPAAMMHPWLAVIGALVSRTLGHLNFHAGGVIVDERVWVFLGIKHAGKSTAVAHLWSRGQTVTADDLVVIDGATCLSGPGCVDLREPSASTLGLGTTEDLGAGRVRARVWTGAPPAEVALGGFVIPTWGADIDVAEVPLAERMPILANARSAYFSTGSDPVLLTVAARPMLRWTRPRDLTLVDEAADHLLAAIASRGSR